MIKEEILDSRHWQYTDFKQRITAKEWRWLLLNNEDDIVFRGNIVRLVGKNLGCGVYEISKQFPRGGR